MSKSNNESREVCTLNGEDAGALCRELLTAVDAPPSRTSLVLRKDQPPSKIILRDTRPYKQRMWSPEVVRRWCSGHQPPRIRKALDCLERLEAVRRMVEALETEHGLRFHFVFAEHGCRDFDGLPGLPESLVDQMGTVENTLAGILTSADGETP